ncbi:MAG TPA: hypothetical protein VG755_14035 [Nannocystaceae bacterium]|nr:hypothetical protein [Nannocystaceae bacterium]
MLALAVVGSLGCDKRSTRPPGAPRKNQFVWARTPAAGATGTCPDDVVDLTGNAHQPTSDQIRCSYADGARGQARIEGKVLRGDGSGLGEGVEGVEVELVLVGEDGSARTIATTRTDAQGGFSLATRVMAGSYVVRSAGGSSMPWEWEGKGPWSRPDLVIYVQ